MRSLLDFTSHQHLPVLTYSTKSSYDHAFDIPGAWSPTGSLAIARLYHTATFLPTGKVLVVAISPAWRAFSDSYCREPSRRNGEGEKGPAIS